MTAACASGNEHIIERLIQCGADINQVDGYYHSPLTVACDKRNENLVNQLLKHNANVIGGDNCHRSPLLAACYTRNSSLVKLLIEYGANVNDDNITTIIDVNVNTPLNIVCKEIMLYATHHGLEIERTRNDHHLSLFDYLEKKKAIIKELIKHGADINKRGKYGFTPLMIACQEQNADDVALFLKHGADVHTLVKNKDGDWDTPLTKVRRFGFQKNS